MNNKRKWDFGIAVILTSSLVLLLSWILPNGRYPMTGYGWHMPMMYEGFSVMSFGMMLLMWLILLGLLLLIGLGITWLVKRLTAAK